MGKQVFLLAKGFSTIITLKQLLSGVSVLMFNDILFLAEGFPTLVTFKRLLSVMKMLMLCDSICG